MSKCADASWQHAVAWRGTAGDVELVKKLIASKARSECPQCESCCGAGGGRRFAPACGEVTPLHFAARANQLEIVKLLVAAGADPKLKGEDGTTLVDASRWQQQCRNRQICL